MKPSREGAFFLDKKRGGGGLYANQTIEMIDKSSTEARNNDRWPMK